MSDTPLTTLQACLVRWQSGDSQAREELLAHSCTRLRSLCQRMFKDFPGLRAWEETDDVLQESLVRLCRALDEVKPSTTRHFLRLAALQMRRQLIDLARHHQRAPRLLAARQGSSSQGGSSEGASADPSQVTHEPSQLRAWTELHEHIEALPDEEKEVFDLLWYQDMSQVDAAALLGVDRSTVIRRWLSARRRLVTALKGQLPGMGET